ncbi:four helix bundle protein [Desulfonema ishimotonii]|uniref:Four helix bundle protein n=2 Tax=Desulfonema ishimotonii TaxID=45657 RepID=A0A401FWN9_9BACT|nr:four helix bundle protein [Desulfonema ishimotonii]
MSIRQKQSTRATSNFTPQTSNFTLSPSNFALPDRTKEFALRIIRLCLFLDQKPGVSRTLANQLLRSGTSIGANVAEGKGAQSERDFLTKYSIAVKEAHETQYWLDLISRSELVAENRLANIRQECNELVAILTTICKKLKKKRK